MDRKAKIELIWKKTHRDFRGGKGAERSILVHRPGVGTCSILLSDLTDADIAEKLPKMGLWRLNEAGGSWVLENRYSIDDAERWLAIWKRDEPDAEFCLSFDRPVTEAEKELKRQARERRSKR